MTSNYAVLGRLGPNSLVDLRVDKSDDLDAKDDLRRTRVLDVTDAFSVQKEDKDNRWPCRRPGQPSFNK